MASGEVEAVDAGRRLAIAAALGMPVVALTLVPALQFGYWQWLSLTLAAPVVCWSAWPFHRAAWDDLRRAAASPATLVSVSSAVGLLWSSWALLLGGAGTQTVRVGLGLDLARQGAPGSIYLGAVVVVVGGAAAARWLDAAGRETRRPRHVDLRPGRAHISSTSPAMPIRLVARPSGPLHPARGVPGPIGRRARRAQVGGSGAGTEVAGVLGPAGVVLAAATLGFWVAAAGDGADAAAYATAVLMLVSPVGLGLARSCAFVLGAPRLRQLGIEVEGPAVLRAARRVDTIVVRKPGALTTGPSATVAADTVRPTAARAVAALRDLGVEPVLLTAAPSRRVDDPVATAVGIDEVVNGVPVGRTAEAVAMLQGGGRVVATMGDDVDDVRPLAQADLGIAHRPSTDRLGVLHPSLERTELWTAVDAIRLARTMDNVVRSNVVLATAMNVAALPLAAGGRLSPAGLVLVMALSVGTVAVNSLRIRRFRRLRPPAHRTTPASSTRWPSPRPATRP